MLLGAILVRALVATAQAPTSPPPPSLPTSCEGFFGDGASPLTVTSETTLDTDASPSGFSYSSLVVDSGATLRATGSNPLVIAVQGVADIQGTIDVSGGKGGSSSGDAMSAGGGAGGGALKIVAAQIIIGANGRVRADGGDGGDAGGPDQAGTAAWFTAGDGAAGVGVAGGYDGGAGAGSFSAGNAGTALALRPEET